MFVVVWLIVMPALSILGAAVLAEPPETKIEEVVRLVHGTEGYGT